MQPPTMPKDVPPTQNYLAPNVREPCSRGTNRIIPIYRRGREAQRGEVSCPKSHSQELAEPQFEARLPDLRVHAPRALPQDHPMRQVLLLIHTFQMGKRYRAGGGTEPVCHRAKKARSQELDPEHRGRGTQARMRVGSLAYQFLFLLQMLREMELPQGRARTPIQVVLVLKPTHKLWALFSR